MLGSKKIALNNIDHSDHKQQESSDKLQKSQSLS